ncbi:MAG: AarF/UbiB family protein [Saprospiraceae bacterium]
MKGKKLSRSWRSRKIYSVVFRILIAYLWVYGWSKILGRKYWIRKSPKLHVKSANRLRKTLLELEGLFIKIGQLVSILSGFLPDEFRKPLEDFQDKAPAQDFEIVKAKVEKELGGKIEEHFLQFSKEPIASASIGQVHRATLKNGKDVVVKIQHPHIPDIAEIDLQLFENIVKIHSILFHIKGIEFVSGQVRQMIAEELDYQREASNLQRMKLQLASESMVQIPDLIEEYTTPTIITSTYCEGCKINDVATLQSWGLDPEKIATQLIELCCKMVLVDGVYHADPHPGNIHVNKAGQLILFDFGAISTVPPAIKTNLPKLIEAATKNDTEATVEAMKAMGFVSGQEEAIKFAEKLIALGQEFLRNEIQMDGLNIKEVKIDMGSQTFQRLLDMVSIRDITNTFQVPKDYILLNRMLILATGISSELAPKLNPLDVIMPYLKRMVLRDGKSFRKFVTDSLRSNLTTLLTLPGEAQKVLQKAKKGELEIRLRDLDSRLQLFYRLGQQFIWLLTGVVSGVLAYNAYMDGFEELYLYGKVGMGISTFLFVRAIWIARRIRKRI